jgi:hypothetical protein
MKTIKFFTLILIAILSMNCQEFLEHSGQIEKVSKTLSFKDINKLDFANVTGSVTLIGWDKNEVEINYKKKARSKETLKKLIVRVDQKNQTLIINTDYPKRCRRCSVSYKIHLPKRMKDIYLRTVTGSINIRDIEYVNKIHGRSVTGSVRAKLACKDAKFSLVTGSISLTLNDIDRNGSLDLSVTTGSIKIYPQNNFEANLDLKTTTGRVLTEYPLSVVKTRKKRRLKGKIGSGSVELSARSVTGSIKILKHK